jgi:hypothetical protein
MVRLHHHVPDVSHNMTGKIDAAYEAEVQRSTENGEKAYARAQKRLAAAEARAARLEREVAEARSPKERRLTKKELGIAWALVELRRDDLNLLHRQMTSTPASATHRGDGSYRPVPIRHGGAV